MSELFLNAVSGMNAGLKQAGAIIQQGQMQQVDAAWKNRELANKEELQAEQITSLRQSRDLAADQFTFQKEESGKNRKLTEDQFEFQKNEAKANRDFAQKKFDKDVEVIDQQLANGKISRQEAELKLDLAKQQLADYKDVREATVELNKATIKNKTEELKPLADQAKTIWESMGTGTPMPAALQKYLASAEIAALDPTLTSTTRARTASASTTNAGSAGTNELKSYVDNLGNLAEVKIKLDGMVESPAKVELQAKYKEAVNSLNLKDATITGGIGTMATLTDKINKYVSQADAAKAEIEDAKGGSKANQVVEPPVTKAPVVRDLAGQANAEAAYKNMPERKPIIPNESNLSPSVKENLINRKLEESISTDLVKMIPKKMVHEKGYINAGVRADIEAKALKIAKEMIPPGETPTQEELTIISRKALNLAQNKL